MQILSMLATMTGADYDSRLDPLFRLSNAVVDDDFSSTAIAQAKIALKSMHLSIKEHQPSSTENFIKERRLPKTIFSCAACGMRQDENHFGKEPYPLEQLSLFMFE